MSPFRHRDEGPSTGTILGIVAGAAAGFAIAMYVTKRVRGAGGFAELFGGERDRQRDVLRDRIRRNRMRARGRAVDYSEDVFEDIQSDAALEESVLEAFRNDEILSERAIDIGSIAQGVIELAGWVEDEDEAEYAVRLARGVPGVETVVNRIAIGEEEDRYAEAKRRMHNGDDSLTEARWEGNGVGTGRRRQGNSDEYDRHATPKPELEERWQRTNEALRNSADDVEALEEPLPKPGRVPFADHTDQEGTV
jgi:BON domain